MDNRPATSANPGRRAFTLIELLIVLAIMAAVAAMALPRLRAAVGRSQLQLSAQQMAKHLTSARLFAIEHGVIYEVQRDATGQRYVVRPQSAANPLSVNTAASGAAVNGLAAGSNIGSGISRGSSRGASAALQASSLARQPELIDGELLKGIQFIEPMSLIGGSLDGESAATINTQSQLGRRLASRQSQPAKGQPASGQTGLAGLHSSGLDSWTRVARFFPDGRADSASVMLYSDDGHRIELTVRRLTGGVQVGFVERQPLNQSEALDPSQTDSTRAATSSQVRPSLSAASR